MRLVLQPSNLLKGVLFFCLFLPSPCMGTFFGVDHFLDLSLSTSLLLGLLEKPYLHNVGFYASRCNSYTCTSKVYAGLGVLYYKSYLNSIDCI